jgi:hypothetical protein
MRRPGQGYIVVVAEMADAGFADRDEACEYADPYGALAQVQRVPWWPAGVWRYGIATSAGGSIGRPPSIPAGVFRAQQRHTQNNRRCAGAGMDVVAGPHGLTRYHCPNCQDRIYP